MKLVALCGCSLDFDMDYVPFFLEHYRSQGIEEFYFVFHSQGEKTNIDFKALFKGYKCNYKVVKKETFKASRMVQWKLEFINGIISPETWFLHADVDEHTTPNKGTTLAQLAARLHSTGFDSARGVFVDRLPADGVIRPLDQHTPLAVQFPFKTNLTRCAGGGSVDKVPLLKSTFSWSPGNHQAYGRPKHAVEILDVHHYKWAGNVIDKLRERVTNYKSMKISWQYSASILDFYSKGMRFDISSLRQKYPDFKASVF